MRAIRLACDELRHLVAFARFVADQSDEARLTTAACEHITSVLNLQRCVWEEGRGEATAPMLLADGNVMGRMIDLNQDRATLPDHLEIPVWIDDVSTRKIRRRSDQPTRCLVRGTTHRSNDRDALRPRDRAPAAA